MHKVNLGLCPISMIIKTVTFWWNDSSFRSRSGLFHFWFRYRCRFLWLQSGWCACDSHWFGVASRTVCHDAVCWGLRELKSALVTDNITSILDILGSFLHVSVTFTSFGEPQQSGPFWLFIQLMAMFVRYMRVCKTPKDLHVRQIRLAAVPGLERSDSSFKWLAGWVVLDKTDSVPRHRNLYLCQHQQSPITPSISGFNLVSLALHSVRGCQRWFLHARFSVPWDSAWTRSRCTHPRSDLRIPIFKPDSLAWNAQNLSSASDLCDINATWLVLI